MSKQTRQDIQITDVTLRDGSHAMAHQFTKQQVRDVTRALDDAGMHYIEVSHGDGLGGSTLQYGRSLENEFKLIETAVEETKNSKIAVLLLPGIGTVHELKEAQNIGARLVRVATHVTEADVSAQHLQDRKSTRLNSSHVSISYAVFCLKKKIDSQSLVRLCWVIVS